MILKYKVSILSRLQGPKRKILTTCISIFQTEKLHSIYIEQIAKISDEKIKVVPFIPPKLFSRYQDLSKHSFNARKNNSNLKTQIRLGEQDFISSKTQERHKMGKGAKS